MKEETNPFISKTWRLLQNRPARLTLARIAKDTGLTPGWLSMFKQGRISNPTYNNITKLHDYLSK